VRLVKRTTPVSQNGLPTPDYGSRVILSSARRTGGWMPWENSFLAGPERLQRRGPAWASIRWWQWGHGICLSPAAYPAAHFQWLIPKVTAQLCIPAKREAL
jgi:hypothetical protein